MFDISNRNMKDKNFAEQSVGKTILIVGNNYESLLLLKTLLELWNYQTVESYTVGEAENVLKLCTPQMILLDTNSSFGETLENIYKVRQNKLFLSLPLVVISGYVQKNYRDLAISNGADGYLVKPLNFAHLERMLKKYETEVVADGGNL